MNSSANKPWLSDTKRLKQRKSDCMDLISFCATESLGSTCRVATVARCLVNKHSGGEETLTLPHSWESVIQSFSTLSYFHLRATRLRRRAVFSSCTTAGVGSGREPVIKLCSRLAAAFSFCSLVSPPFYCLPFKATTGRIYKSFSHCGYKLVELCAQGTYSFP